MDELTNEASPTSTPASSPDTSSATSSPGSGAGLLPFAWLDGPTTGPSGRVPAPANHFPTPARDSRKPTTGTCGPCSSGSSASASLAWSLANRLQARLPCGGGMEYRMIWKQRITPAGRLIYALRASAHRTSGSGCTGWPTVTVEDHKSDGPKTEQEYANAIAEGRPVRQSAQRLRNTVLMAGWTTPQACEGPNMSTTRENGRQAKRITPQTVAGILAGWATPAERDFRMPNKKPFSKRGGGKKGEQLPNQVAHDGPTAESSSAGTGKPAAYLLNPRFSLWLQGYPAEIISCAERAIQSCRPLRRSSSKRACKEAPTDA